MNGLKGEIMDDFDENNDCVTKSRLIVKVKTLSKYNNRRGWQPNEQTNKQPNILRDTETDKHLGKKILKKQKEILINRRTSRLTVDTRTQRVKQKMKNEAPYVLLLLK